MKMVRRKKVCERNHLLVMSHITETSLSTMVKMIMIDLLEQLYELFQSFILVMSAPLEKKMQLGGE